MRSRDRVNPGDDMTPTREFLLLRARMIQAARRDGMTQDQIAKVLFTDQKTVSRWERWAQERGPS